MAKLRTRGTKAHNSEPPAKRTRAATTTAMLTRTIHQQVTSQPHQTGTVTVSMGQQLKKLVKNNKIPSSRSTTVGGSESCLSGLSVHPTRAQHSGFQSPSPGWESPLLSHQLCSGVPGVHPHPGLPLIQIVMDITVTGNNQVWGHTHGLNRINNSWSHLLHRSHNRPVNWLTVLGDSQQLPLQQHFKNYQTTIVVRDLQQKMMQSMTH